MRTHHKLASATGSVSEGLIRPGARAASRDPDRFDLPVPWKVVGAIPTIVNGIERMSDLPTASAVPNVFPKAIADDGRRSGIGSIVDRVSARPGRHAEDVEVVVRHDVRRRKLRTSVDRGVTWYSCRNPRSSVRDVSLRTIGTRRTKMMCSTGLFVFRSPWLNDETKTGPDTHS